MKNVELYIPKIDDLWFRERRMSDPKTMDYNAGYDASYEGYHYDTGCIDFPKEKHKTWHDQKMSNPNFFYAFILDKDTHKFVGHAHFNLNPENDRASMGIGVNSEFRGQGYMRPAMLLLIDEAKKRNVKFLTDSVPQAREKALKVFFDLGFVKTKEYIGKKFGKDELVFDIERKI